MKIWMYAILAVLTYGVCFDAIMRDAEKHGATRVFSPFRIITDLSK